MWSLAVADPARCCYTEEFLGSPALGGAAGLLSFVMPLRTYTLTYYSFGSVPNVMSIGSPDSPPITYPLNRFTNKIGNAIPSTSLPTTIERNVAL